MVLSKAECNRCDGCGSIASGEEGAPWSRWTSLPSESQLAIRMGVVWPIPCPDCNGTGRAALEEPSQ